LPICCIVVSAPEAAAAVGRGEIGEHGVRQWREDEAHAGADEDRRGDEQRHRLAGADVENGDGQQAVTGGEDDRGDDRHAPAEARG
jgi:hypothetical protein